MINLIEHIERRNRERREAWEEAFRAGVNWGYRASEVGVDPEPRIEWDEDGRPHVFPATLESE